MQIRVTPEQYEEIKEAAERDGLTVSGWIRSRLLRCARQERKES